MTSIGSSVTAIATKPWPLATNIDISEEENREFLKIGTIPKAHIYRFSLGAILSFSLLTIAFLFAITFIATLVYRVPFVSTKLALFLFLLSSGFGFEILAAKKLKNK